MTVTSKGHDRMLEVLRSLTPPRSAPEGAVRRPESEASDDAAGADGEPAQRASSRPALSRAPAEPDASCPALGRPSVIRNGAEPDASRPARDGKVIQLRMEEVGVFFLAGVVLVVMAFLMGWYGRGTGAVPGRLNNLLTDPTRPGRLDTSAGTARRLALEARGDDLGTRAGRVTTASARTVGTFSILLARFPLGGGGDAEDHRLSLRQRGYPAWLRRTPEGIELCVGRFDSPAGGLARQWLPKLEKLSAAYSSARIVRIP